MANKSHQTSPQQIAHQHANAIGKGGYPGGSNGNGEGSGGGGNGSGGSGGG